jgi:hypothetical protein
MSQAPRRGTRLTTHPQANATQRRPASPQAGETPAGLLAGSRREAEGAPSESWHHVAFARCDTGSGTDFKRDDARQERQAAWLSKVPYFKPEVRDGVLVLSGRETHSDFADTEYEVSLDAAGQLTMLRQRSAEFGVIPAGRWATTRYRYPTATEFARLAGTVPQPPCD